MCDDFHRRAFLNPLPEGVPRLSYWPPTDTVIVAFEELIPGTCTPVRDRGRRCVIIGEGLGADGSGVWGYEFARASKGCDLRGAHRADDIAREIARWRLDVPIRRHRFPRVMRAVRWCAAPAGAVIRRLSPRRRAALARIPAAAHLGLTDALACTAPEWALLTEGLGDAPRAQQRAAIRRWIDDREPSAHEWREVAEWALRD